MHSDTFGKVRAFKQWNGVQPYDSPVKAKRHFYSVSGVPDYIDSNISFWGIILSIILSCFGAQLLVECSTGMQALISLVFSSDLDNTVLRANSKLGSSSEPLKRRVFCNNLCGLSHPFLSFDTG